MIATTDMPPAGLEEPATRTFGELVGTSDAMANVCELAAKVASLNVTVLINGETGTGKELLAHAIHDWSSRASGPFIAFSCANLPETLVDDELFGHEKGAFTGADGPRRGRFEAANGGTLFLDEIGDLPLALQARLLRVLQQRSFERLGGNNTVKVDIRLICATHCDLDAMVREGTFRQDLLYRLNVIQIHMPALRNRGEDVALLARHFVRLFASSFDQPVRGISDEALIALTAYSWPGNVRELENVIQRAVALAETTMIGLAQLPIEICGLNVLERPAETGQDVQESRCGVQETGYNTQVREFKRRLLIRTLQQYHGNKTRAAESLHLARPYLYRLIEDLGVGAPASELRSQRQLAAT